MIVRRRAMFVLAACAFAGAAAAQALDDPTRPPPMLVPGAAKEESAAPVDTTPRLQSVLIGRGPGARHVAVIDGQTVRLGEKFRGARLERVTDTEVVLVSGTHRQVLKLFPAAAPDAAKP
jgi:MSHA biogenesis protein MshK